MIIRMILYVLIALSILFGLYKMFIDDEKGVGYASFIFAILVFLLTLIPTSTEDVPSKEEQTIEFEDKESEVEDNTAKESAEVEMKEEGEETNTQSTENVIQEMEFESNNTIEESNTIEINVSD